MRASSEGTKHVIDWIECAIEWNHLAGSFSAAPFVLVSASYSGLWYSARGGTAAADYSVASVTGPTLGPTHGRGPLLKEEREDRSDARHCLDSSSNDSFSEYTGSRYYFYFPLIIAAPIQTRRQYFSSIVKDLLKNRRLNALVQEEAVRGKAGAAAPPYSTSSKLIHTTTDVFTYLKMI